MRTLAVDRDDPADRAQRVADVGGTAVGGTLVGATGSAVGFGGTAVGNEVGTGVSAVSKGGMGVGACTQAVMKTAARIIPSIRRR